MSNEKKPQAPPVGIRLGEELQEYLRAQAAKNFRSLSSEIAMRLELSRQADQASAGAAQ